MAARIISLFNTKGGVGKTLVATSLASTLRLLFNRKAAIIELGGSGKDVLTMLGSVDVLCVPASQVSVDSLPALLENLGKTHAFILIDIGSVFSEVAVQAFERSHLILIVTTPDIVSLQHATRSVELLDQLKFPLSMIKTVINRADTRGNLSSRDIKERFPAGVIAELPSDGRLVGFSVNQGVPLGATDAASRIQEAFRRFARLLIETPALYIGHFAIDKAKVADTVQRVPVVSSRSEDGQLTTQTEEDPIIGLKRRIHARLIEKFDLKRLDLKGLSEPGKGNELRERTARAIVDLMAEEGGFVTQQEERERLVREIVDEALALGPLEDLIRDPEVSDILVNAKDRIYVERRGKLHLTKKKFVSNDQVLAVIERIIAPLGRRIDESNPMVDARMPDGSRVNAIISPLSIRGPMLSIRKFSRERFTMEDLVTFKTLDRPMADFLTVCVKARKNIIVSGGTGSGKTTVLNVLSAFISEDERILTIEDAAELRLEQEHWVPLETRIANIEGKGIVTMRQLFRNALRMRPDRIIIGECRGDETLDMLQAMNTGHDGSLTTLHANSPQDVISRLDTLILMSNVELPVRAIREQIASAVDLVVHTARLSDGSRKVTQISEITGLTEDNSISFGDIFLFKQVGLSPKGEVMGSFSPSGRAPSFLAELRAKGFAIDEGMFRAVHERDREHEPTDDSGRPG